MYIITNKTIQFRNLKVDKDQNGQLVANVIADSENGGDVIVPADSKPQYAPDWIKNDPMFGLSVKDGSILEIEIKGQDAPQATPKQQPKAGWAKPEDNGLESK